MLVVTEVEKKDTIRLHRGAGWHSGAVAGVRFPDLESHVG